MHKLTLTEALIIDLIGRDGVDQTNVIHMLRKAQDKLRELPFVDQDELHRPIDEEDAETAIGWASRGGERDLYS